MSAPGASGKGAKGKDGSIAKAAGVAIATGIAWSIYKSIMARKEEDALIEEYYGSVGAREDFGGLDHATSSKEPEPEVKEKIVEKTEEKTEELKVTEGSAVELDAEVVEKSWFFFGDGKKKASKPKAKPIESYDIVHGDTLYGISRKHGVSLESLKAANGLSGDDIYAGDRLTIPK